MTNWIYSYLKYGHLLTQDQKSLVKQRFLKELEADEEALKDVPEELRDL